MKSTIILALTITILLVASLAFASSDQRYWQLTMSYDQDGPRILEAGQIPITRKTVHTPGLEAAPIRIPYDIDWLDASGSLILSTTTELPIGFRSAPDESGAPCQMIVPASGIIALRMLGPQLPTQAASVRFTRSGAVLMKMSTQTLPSGVDL